MCACIWHAFISIYLCIWQIFLRTLNDTSVASKGMQKKMHAHAGQARNVRTVRPLRLCGSGYIHVYLLPLPSVVIYLSARSLLKLLDE